MNTQFFSLQRILGLLLLLATAGACAAAMSCRHTGESGAKPVTATSTTPTLRLYVASTLAGAIEPCGCRKDMLGGVDHAAAMIAKGKQEAPSALVLSAGPLFFMNPELAVDKRQQELLKARGIAGSAADFGLVAWAPGVNDFAPGLDELKGLAASSSARMLAANLHVPGAPLEAVHVMDVGGTKLGLVGVSDLPSNALPAGSSTDDLKASLEKAKAEASAQGAKLLVALVAAQRGQALRMAELVPGFQVMVVGKPLDRGESNDAPTPPVLIGQTLVVQAPNHLQAMAIVDLFVKDGELNFQDGSGIDAEEQRTSLQSRIDELSHRIDAWKTDGSVAAKDIAARQTDLAGLQKQLADLNQPKSVPSGSFFRYELRQIKEGLGHDERVEARLAGYYKQVNDFNKDAFKDKRPLEPKAGDPHYVGVQACSTCHQTQYAFWQTTRHAGAYPVLARQFKEFNLDCVGCHVTGYDRPGGSTVTFVEGLQGVQCEQCHGPGSIHAQTKTKESIRRMPMPDVCQQCHHSPHVADDWTVREAWPHIIGPGHGLPLTAAAASSAGVANEHEGIGGAGN